MIRQYGFATAQRFVLTITTETCDIPAGNVKTCVNMHVIFWLLYCM